MKKISIYLGAALLGIVVLVSCNKDARIADNADLGVNFRVTSGALTKATPTTVANLGSFKVTAIGNSANFFTDLNVAVTSAGVCTPEKTYYWPGYELGFYAYANPSGGTASITNAAKSITGVTPAAAAASQTDFVVAYNTGTKASNMASGVPLNFRHAFSQIVVRAANKSTTGLKIYINGVKVGNVKTAGDFTYPAAVTNPHNGGTLTRSLWDVSGASLGDYTISGSASLMPSSAADMMFAGTSWMLVPQQLTAWDLANDKTNTSNGSYLALNVRILDAADNQLYPATAGEYAYANVPIDTEWQPGKRYTYTLNFLDETTGGGAGVDDNGEPVLGSPINFTLTVDDWDGTIESNVTAGMVDTEIEKPGVADPANGDTDCISFSSPVASTFSIKYFDESIGDYVYESTPGYNFEYSLGDSWIPYNGEEISFGAGTVFSLRGKNSGGFDKGETDGKYMQFVLTGDEVSCRGNIMKLLDYETDMTTVPCEECFEDLFSECAALVSAPDLPATGLTDGCYVGMFSGTGLREVPQLPATELAPGCYSGMFSGCNSLTEINVPYVSDFSRLQPSCFNYMYEGCEGIRVINFPYTAAQINEFVGNIGREPYSSAFRNFLSNSLSPGGVVHNDPSCITVTEKNMKTMLTGWYNITNFLTGWTFDYFAPDTGN